VAGSAAGGNGRPGLLTPPSCTSPATDAQPGGRHRNAGQPR
jgi:hypothetical protein